MKEIKRLIHATLTLLKIKVIKKSVRLLTDLVSGFILLLLVLISLFFLGIALALYISSLFHSYFLGFLVTGAGGIILLLLFQLFKPQIKRLFRDIFTRILTEKEDEEEK